MMDFNQILLFTGLGLLVLVILFALWGFLGGLKRELKCIAVFIVLLVLVWLVFGDSATILNAKFGKALANALKIQGDSISTVWDAILAFARDKIPNGGKLLVEGKETYAFFYAVVSGVARTIGLLAGTLVVIVLCPIIRLITHIIGLIIAGSKKRKAKKKAAVNTTDSTEEEETSEEEGSKEQVVLSSGETSVDEAVITKSANPLPVKPKGKKRWWGAFAATLKGVFVVILLFTPISGLCSVLNTATPETQAMLSDLVGGKKEEKTSNSQNVVEMAFGFADAYEESAVGKFVESSSYFFGKSFSESFFKNVTKIETKNQNFSLGDELITIVKAANELHGNLEVGTWTQLEVVNALGQLKNSNLLVEVMPVAIEYAYEIQTVKDMVTKANQIVAFLDLRYVNWRADLPIVFDTVAEAYRLDLFPMKDLNFLTLDAEILREVLNTLTSSEFGNKVLPIGVSIATTLDVVVNNVGKVEIPNLAAVNWNKEVNTIVDAYVLFQGYGITSLKDFDFNAFLKEVLNSEEKTNRLFDLVNTALNLQILEQSVVPVAIEFAAKQEKVADLLAKSGQMAAFKKLKTTMTMNDIRALVATGKQALGVIDFTNYPKIDVDYLNLDVNKLYAVVDELTRMAALDDILNIGTHIALSIDKVVEMVGELDIDLSKVSWSKDLNSLVGAYGEFQKLGYKTLDDFKAYQWNDHINNIVTEEEKFESTKEILETIVDLDVYNALGNPAVQNVIDKLVSEKADKFAGIVDVTGFTAEQWKSDLFAVLDIVKAVNELKVLEHLNPFDYTKMDITSALAIANAKLIIEKALSLQILGSDETKNNLLLASIEQYKWLADGAEVVLDDVKWEEEIDVLHEIVDAYDALNQIEGFDIYNIKDIKWGELLEKDEFIDSIVDVLDSLVNSNVFLSILPAALDKYLLPKVEALDKIDDETLFKDILDKVSSEELVNELIKLIDVVRAAIDFGLLKVNQNGIEALDLANTEALKTIVSGIFDSKLIQGHEGRIIRIILKVTGILDIAKDSEVYNQLVALDYTGEKDVLLSFIDDITPVLQDEDFSIMKDGKFNLDLKFWAENKNASLLIEGLKTLIGTYENNDSGSQLIEVLLPNIYDKFVEEKNLIPADFVEIVNTLGVTDASGEVLAHDIRCLVYILDQVVAINGQSFLDGGKIYVNEALKDSLHNIIDALHEIELIKGHEEATLVWGVNYVAKLAKIELNATELDFEVLEIDWQAEKEVYKDIISDIVNLLIVNNIDDTDELMEVVKGLKAKDSPYITDANAHRILDILDQVIDVKVIDAIIPLIVKFGVSVLDDKGIALNYINKFTNKELAADFHAFVKIAHNLVDDLNIVAYYQNNFDGDIALPNEAGLKALIDSILDLNIIKLAHGELATMIFEKIVAMVVKDETKTFILTADDFAFDHINWDQEGELVKLIIGAVYDVFEINNVTTLGNARKFVTEKWYFQPAVINQPTVSVLTDLIREIKDSQLLGNVIEKVYDYAIDTLDQSGKVPFSILTLRGMPKEMLIADIATLADILDEAVEFGVLEYITDKEISHIDVELLSQMIEHLYQLNVVKENIDQIAYKGLNYVAQILNTKFNQNIVIPFEEVDAIDFENEFAIIGDTIIELGKLMEVKSLERLTDILRVIGHKEYNNKEFFDVATGEVIASALDRLLDLHTLEVMLPHLVNVGVDQVKAINLSFLKGAFTGEELVSDLKALLNAIVPAIEADLVGLAFKADFKELTINVKAYNRIIDAIKDMNLINKHYDQLMEAVVNYGLEKAKINKSVTAEDFAGVTFSGDAQAIKKALEFVDSALNQAKLVTINDVLTIVKEKKFTDPAYAKDSVAYPLIDAVAALLDAKTVQAIVPTMAEYGVELAGKKGFEVDFLIEGLTKDQLVADLVLVTEYLRDAVYVDVLEYVTTKDIKDLNVEKIAEMVEGLYRFNMLQGNMPQVLELVFSKVAHKVPAIDLYFFAHEFENVDFENEFKELSEVILALRPFMNAVDYQSLNDLLDMIKNKDYNYYNFFNEDSYSALVNAVVELADVKMLGVILPRAIDYAIEMAENKGFNLNFFSHEVYTGELILSDVKVLASIALDAYDFGIIDYVFDKDIPVIDEQIINRMIAKLGDLNLLQLYFADLLALGVNKGMELAKIDVMYEAADFSGVVLAEELEVLQTLVVDFKAFMNAKELVSLSDVLLLINNKDYANKEFYDVELGNVAQSLVNHVADLESLKVVLPELFDYALGKLNLKGLSFDFLKGSFTGEELASDIKALSNAIVPAIEADLVGLAFKEDFKELAINVKAYNRIIDAIKDMNLINKHYDQLMVEVVNYGLDKLNSNSSVKVADFAGVTFSGDAQAIKKALEFVDSALNNAKLVTVNDVLTIVKEKKFTDSAYAKDSVVYPLIDAVAALLDSLTVQAVVPALAEHAVDFASQKGFEVDFLIEGLTKDQLVADLVLVTEYLRDAVYVDVLEYVTTKDIKDLNVEKIAEMVEGLYRFNMLQGNMPQVLELVFSKVNLKAIELDFVAKDFEHVDFEQEFKEYAQLVLVLRSFMDVKGYKSLSDLLDIVKNKEYNNKEYYDVETGLVIEKLLNEAVDSQVVQVVLPTLVDYAIDQVKGIDLSFLKGAFTGEELASDIRQIAKVVVPAIKADLVGLAFKADVKELTINIAIYKEILDHIKDINLINKHYDQLMATLVNYGLGKLNSNSSVKAADFVGATFSGDVQVIKKALDFANSALNNAKLVTVNDVLTIVKEKKFTDPAYAKDSVVYPLIDAVAALLDSLTVQAVVPALAEHAVDFASQKGFEVDFLIEGLTKDQLVADLVLVTEYLRDAVYVDVLEYVTTKDIKDLNVEKIAEMVEGLYRFNMLQGNMPQVLELVFSKVNLKAIELDFVAKDFEHVDFEQEFKEYAQLVLVLRSFMDVKGYKSLSDLLDIVKNKEYNNKEYYDVETGLVIEKLLNEAVDSQVVQVVLPTLVDYAIDQVKGIDLSFLKGAFTGEELASDIRQIAQAVLPAIKADLVGLAFKEDVKELTLDFDHYVEILRALQNTNLINKKYAELVSTLVNKVLDMAHAKESVKAADFEGVVFANDVEHLISAIDQLQNACATAEIVKVNDILDIIKNKSFKDEKYANAQVVKSLLGAASDLVEAGTIQSLLPALANHAADYLAQKGIDIEYLFENATKEELTADINSIISAINSLVDYGIIEIVLFDGFINTGNTQLVHSAIDEIMNLNILAHNKSKVIMTVLEQLKVETEGIDLSTIDHDFELTQLHNLVYEVTELLVELDVNRISEIKGLTYVDVLKINRYTNERFETFATILELLSQDQLLEAIVLPVSKRFLKDDNKYAGLINLHNIYNDGAELQADLVALTNVIYAIIELDINSFTNKQEDYPFHRTDLVEVIINNVFNLNYLNNENRLSEILHNVDDFVGFDLSQLSLEGVDLSADADEFIEMYGYFYEITQNKYWTLNNVTSKFDAALLIQAKVLEKGLQLINTYMETTIFDKTGFVALIFAIPLLEKAAPKYYEALDLANVTKEMLEHDAQYLQHILSTLNELDLEQMIRNEDFYSTKAYTAIRTILNDIYSLEILKGHANALFNVLADDLFNGKKLLSVNIPEGTLSFDNTDFVADKALYETIIDEIYLFFIREGITNNAELKDFFNSLKDKDQLKSFLSKEETWVMIDTIINSLVNNTIVEHNGLSLINNVVKPLVEERKASLAQFVDFTMYSQTDFTDDLRLLGVLATALKEFGIADVFADNLIPYEKVTEVQRIIVALTSFTYIDHHLDDIIDYLGKTKLPISLEALRSEEFNHHMDAYNITLAYEELAKYLASEANPIKRLSDIQKLINKEIKFTKENINELLDYSTELIEAYECLTNCTGLVLLLPEIYRYAERLVPDKYKDIYNAISFEGLSYEEIKADLVATVVILRGINDLELRQAIKDKDMNFTGTAYSTASGETVEKYVIINSMITAIEELNCVVSYSDIVISVLEMAKVDVSEINLSSVNWAVEFENLRTIITNLIKVSEQLGINNIAEAKSYAKSYTSKNIKDKLTEVYDTVDLDSLAAIVNALDASEVLVQTFKPLYNKYISSKIPAKFAAIGDLTDYSMSALDEDIHHLALTVQALADMKAIVGNVKENPESLDAIALTRVMIENIFATNILQLKAQDIVEFVDSEVKGIDLSTLDLSQVDFENDGLILGQYAKEILYVAIKTEGMFRLSLLGETPLMEDVISLYNGLLETELFESVLYWAYDKYVAPKVPAASLRHSNNHETAKALANEVAVVLEGLFEMGVFSNEGFDFTNKEATDKLFGIFENVFIFTENTMKHVNKIKDSISVLGVIPFNYSNLNIKNEIATIKEVITEAKSLTTYKNDFKVNPIKTLSKVSVQVDIVAVVNKLLESKVANQLLVPVLNGIVKLYTKDIVEITILEGVSNSRFVKTFLNDVFDLAESVNAVVHDDMKINYSQVAEISGIIEVIVHRNSFKDHVEDILKLCLYLVGIDLREEDFSNVDWEAEYQALDKALGELAGHTDDMSLRDKELYKNTVLLSGIAKALPHLNDSELVAIVLRPAIEKLLNSKESNDIYINHLYRSSYTDELLMADFAKLPTILNAFVDMDYFNGNIDYSNLDPLAEMIEVFFQLEYIKGIEAQLLTKLTEKISLINDYNIDFYAVADWSVEGPLFVEIIKELATLGILVDVNNFTEEALRDIAVQDQFIKLVDALSKSEFGQQFLPQYYNERISNSFGGEYYEGIIDFSLEGFTPDKWAAEFSKLFAVYNELVACGYGTSEVNIAVDEALSIMKKLFGTRDNKEAGIMTVVNDPKLWLTRLYDNKVVSAPTGAELDLDSERDWADEPYKVMDVLEEMQNFTDAEGNISYEKVYECKDEQQLHDLFEVIVECDVIKSSMMSIVVNSMNNNPEVKDQLEAAGVLDDDFYAEYDSYVSDGSFDENYWTVDKLMEFAKGISLGNQQA